MDTVEVAVKGERRRRRRHSDQFKDEVVAACRRPGVSIASVAMANGVNANLLRRWVVEQERKQTLVVRESQGAAEAADKQAFLPIQFATHAVSEPEIRIELRRGATTVNVSWPSSASAACAAWLREILK